MLSQKGIKYQTLQSYDSQAKRHAQAACVDKPSKPVVLSVLE